MKEYGSHNDALVVKGTTAMNAKPWHWMNLKPDRYMDTSIAISQCAFHLFLSILMAYVLFREARESRNPFKWSKTDRALFLIALFYFVGGLLPILSPDYFLHSSPQHQIADLWRRSFHSILSVGGYWILLLAFSLWLQRDPPKRKNPLEWGAVDRTLLLIWVFLFVGGIDLLERLLLSSAQEPPWINQAFVMALRPIHLAEGAFVLLLLFAGLWLRRRAPENRIFVHVVIQYAAVSIAFNAYSFGALTDANAFLGGMALGAFALLLFQPSVALPAMSTFMVLTVGATIASGMGLIPYAPQYSASPIVDGKIDSAYLVSSLTWTTIVFLLIMSLMTFVLVRWRDREGRLSEMTVLLKKMFGRYLSTEVMNAIIENPTSLELGGERRRVTIMMTDLRGFTALSERLEPEQVVQMLNAYFEVMVDIVLEFNGTINEFIGDALLVVFGAPQEIKDRAERAVACAITMQNAMGKVNEQNRAKGLPDIEMGIGLNEAEVILGNIGSSKRSKYAVVGSGVNMASRIESYTVGGQVLISESVRAEAGHILRLDAQREIWPKGSEIPIRIYEVGGIGGTYKVALETGDTPPIPLVQAIPLHCTLLEGKKVEKSRIPCTLVRLSNRGAILQMSEPLEPLMNVKLNLSSAPKRLSTRDFYGKVIDLQEKNGFYHRIRFTAVPPELDAYFQALLQYATEMIKEKGSGVKA